MHDVAAEHLERAAKNHGGCNAIDVVVAMNGDALAPSQCLLQPFDGSIHVGEPERVVQVIERRMEKTRGLVDVAQAAQTQQPGDDRVDPECAGERGRLIVIAW